MPKCIQNLPSQINCFFYSDVLQNLFLRGRSWEHILIIFISLKFWPLSAAARRGRFTPESYIVNNNYSLLIMVYRGATITPHKWPSITPHKWPSITPNSTFLSAPWTSMTPSSQKLSVIFNRSNLIAMLENICNFFWKIAILTRGEGCAIYHYNIQLTQWPAITPNTRKIKKKCAKNTL